jgi:hypothetical protein
MFAVRYVAIVALVVWVGGMLTLGAVVAPTIARGLESVDPAGGRAVADTLLGALIARVHVLAYAYGAVIGFSLLMMKFVGPPPRAFFIRFGIVAVMLALEVYAGTFVDRELAGIRSHASGAIERLPATDERRIAFDRLHATSSAVMGINVALGLVLLFWYARE